MRKKIIALLSVCCIACCALAVACKDPVPTVSLDQTAATLWESEKVTLQATTKNFKGEITWESADKKIATVKVDKNDNTKAVVTAVGAGTTVITAIINEKTKAEFTVECKAPNEIADVLIVDESAPDADDNFIISIPESISAESITDIKYAGDALTIVSKDAAANTVTVSDGGFEYGEGEVFIKTADNAYATNLLFATMVIDDKAEFVEFLESYLLWSESDYIILNDNIDMGGMNITQYTGYAASATDGWKATLDGRGYAISNVQYTHGFFVVCNGTVQNLALVNPIKLTNGGGLLANELRGTIQNVFVYGELTALGQSGIAHTDYAGTIENCFAIVENADGSTGGYALVNERSNGTYSNNWAISATRTEGMYIGIKDASGALTPIEDDKDHLYASIDAFKADANKDISAFEEGFWTLNNGVPFMKNAGGALKFTVATDTLFDGALFGTNFKNAAITFKTEVTGVSYADGKISVENTVADGTKVTLVAATPDNLFKIEKEFTIGNGSFVDKKNVKSDIELTKENTTVTIADIDSTLTADAITAVAVGGIFVDYTIENGKIVIDNATLASAERGDVSLLVFTANTIYETSATVIDLLINDVEGLKEYGTNFAKYCGAGKLVVLNADIDATGLTEFAGDNFNTLTYHTFDGRGHTISNLATNWGFMGIEQQGTLKNIRFYKGTFASDANGTPYAWRGFLTRYMGATAVIENVFVDEIIFNGSAQGVILGLGKSAGALGGTVRNVVIKAETVAGSSALMLACDVYSFGGTLENCYGITTNITKWATWNPSAPATSMTNTKIVASATDLLADTAEGNALSTLNGQGPWKVENGKLYFGTVEVK